MYELMVNWRGVSAPAILPLAVGEEIFMSMGEVWLTYSFRKEDF
jgi:hypothetical protein